MTPDVKTGGRKSDQGGEVLYLIGSLRNPAIPQIAQVLRTAGIDVFDEWYAAGPDADDRWRDYEKGRGWSFERAIRESKAAKHVFEFDRKYLDRCEGAILVCPAGKSAHLELGWVLGAGKPGYILLDSPDRWDTMYQFAVERGCLVTQDIARIIDHYKAAWMPLPV